MINYNKYRIVLIITLIVFLLVSLIVLPIRLIEEYDPNEDNINTTSTSPAIINIAEAEEKSDNILNPTLKRICSCESTGSPNNEPIQYDQNGDVLRGKINPLDIGMCQINLKYHGEAAERMGYDLFTKEGNAKYANWLYKQQGSTPWSWSSHCWK